MAGTCETKEEMNKIMTRALDENWIGKDYRFL